MKNVPSNLNNSKSKVGKLDNGKLETTGLDLSKLSDVVKNEFVKNTEYKEFVKKINNVTTTDNSNLAKETDYNTIINKIEKKIIDHNDDKYITIKEFNKLTTKSFKTRLKQANLGSETDITDITDFVKKTDFDDKLKNSNEKGYFK